MVTSLKVLWLSLLELMLVPATLTTGARARCLLFQSAVVVKLGKQDVAMNAASYFACWQKVHAVSKNKTRVKKMKAKKGSA